MKQNVQPTATIAAACDKVGPDAARMEAYLETLPASSATSNDVSARWYAIRDLDDLDRDVIAGRVETVVFIRWRDLLEGIWNGEITFDRWTRMGVDLQFVESPGTDPSACLAAVADAWSRHKRSRRRRQAVSGLILSAIAVAAAFLLIHP